MARVPPITSPDQVSPDQRHIAEAIAGSRGRIAGPFAVLLHSPEIAGRIAHLGAYIRFESRLPAADRELAILSTAREFACAFEWAVHTDLARQAGVRAGAIDALAEGTAPEGLTSDEALVVRYGQELFRDHRVSDATFEAARARFGTPGVVELTATLGYYAMIAGVLNAFDVRP